MNTNTELELAGYEVDQIRGEYNLVADEYFLDVASKYDLHIAHIMDQIA